MSTPKFAETHNLVVFLEKPEKSNGFEEIIDFLNASYVQYALTANPTISTTCIEQLWASAMAKIVNRERQIQALVDKKKVIITETSIRSDLKLDDAEGTDCLPTATIFVELERMGHKEVYVTPSHTKKVFANIKRSGKGFSRRVTPLFPTMMIQASEDMGEDSAAPSNSHPTPIISQPSLSKPQKKKSKRKQRKDSGPTEPVTDEAHVSTPSYDPPQSAKTSQAKEIASLKKRVKQLEKKKNLRTLRLKEIKEEVTLVDETQEMNDDNMMFDTGVLEEQEKEVAEKEASAAYPVTTANVEVTTANAPTTTIDELTLAQTLIEIKAAKPKVVTSAATITTTTRPKARGVAKDKGKAKMVKPEKPLKKKDQIAIDEEVARNLEAQLQAELEEEEMISRLKEEKAN
ncbi:hypothetical protein Tco_0303427 [Tanacetum coccineum]